MVPRQEARRRALLAAARVAFVATAGCTKEPPAPVAPMTSATPASTSVKTGPGGCTLPSNDNPSEQETACCLAGADAAAGNRGGELGPDMRAPAPIVACCTRVIAYRNRLRSSPHYDSCCAVLNTMDGACTPWGPPVPPPMSRVAVALRKAARRPG